MRCSLHDKIIAETLTVIKLTSDADYLTLCFGLKHDYTVAIYLWRRNGQLSRI